MTKKRLIDGLSFEEYLRRNPMPTQTLNLDEYIIVERNYQDD